jgi:hypothetical protein
MAYYFEMTVKNAGTKGQCSIGFTADGFKMCRQPGYVFVYLCLAKQVFYLQVLLLLFIQVLTLHICDTPRKLQNMLFTIYKVMIVSP